MAFQNMWSELVGVMPNLSPFLAQTYIQRAWNDISTSRNWSYRQTVKYLVAPNVITAGTFAVTYNSTSVVADVTAWAEILPQITAAPPLVGRQWRLANVGILYTIIAVDIPTRTLTLDAPFQGTTNPTQGTYQIYKCLFSFPGERVQRFVSIEDPNNAYAFTRAHVPKVRMDRADPTRSSQGLPVYSVDYDTATVQGFQYTNRCEFWPHPIAFQNFICTVLTLGHVLEEPDDVLPEWMPESLVVNRAMSRYVIPWGQLNQGRFPQLKGVNFPTLKREADADYERDLLRVKIIDDGKMLKSKVVRRGSRYGGIGFPIDANFIQDHDIGGFRLGY